MTDGLNLGAIMGALAGMRMADPDSLAQSIVFGIVGAVTVGTIYSAARCSWTEQETKRREQAKFQYSEI